MHDCQLTACVWLWLNNGLAQCVEMVSSYNGCMQPQQQQSVSVCVVPLPTAHAPTHTCRPSGLLMVHAVLTLAVKVW